MKSRSLLLCLLAVLLALPVAAQDLKPVRDKQSRKYGYQAKDKTWVIEPRFDDATRFKEQSLNSIVFRQKLEKWGKIFLIIVAMLMVLAVVYVYSV